MYPRPTITKACLKTFDNDEEIKVDFDFNPTEISVERGCGFDSATADKNAFKDYGGIQFAGAKVDSISMSFILDTTEPDWTEPAVALSMMSPVIVSSPTIAPASKAGSVPLISNLVNADSVMDTLNDITSMTRIGDKLKEDESGETTPHPRICKFTWGDEIEFTGGIEKFSYKFTLFDSDGVPKRAEVELGMIGIFGPFSGKGEDLLFGEGKSTAKSSRNLGKN